MLGAHLCSWLLVLLGLPIALTEINWGDIQAKPIDDLFQVDFTTADEGGCGPIPRATLQRMLHESARMARAGYQLHKDYDVADESTRLVQTWARGITASEVATAIEWYSWVYEFLTGNIPEPKEEEEDDDDDDEEELPPQGKPYLFCSDTWVERQSLNDHARDISGSEYPSFEPGRVGQPALVREHPDISRDLNGDYEGMQPVSRHLPRSPLLNLTFGHIGITD